MGGFRVKKDKEKQNQNHHTNPLSHFQTQVSKSNP